MNCFPPKPIIAWQITTIVSLAINSYKRANNCNLVNHHYGSVSRAVAGTRPTLRDSFYNPSNGPGRRVVGILVYFIHQFNYLRPSTRFQVI